MKYIIIEDEKPNRLMLEALVSQFRPNWEMLTYFDRVSKAVEYFKENEEPDLIFCDIQLKDTISFEIFNQVEINCPVIFVTAYDEYAIRAFDVKSIDYLLKPIEEGRLLKAITKLEEMTGKSNETGKISLESVEDLLREVNQKERSYRKRFLISGIDSYYKVNTDEIAYFYSESGITTAVLFGGKEHIIDLTLEKLDLQMNPDDYFRANRSMLLNIESVEKFENHFGGKLTVMVKPKYKDQIIVSRLKASNFKKWFDQ